ncbi:MAG: elongation factor 4 [Pseudomonadales bacterium]|nr:translation elongation factor 4 [Candidatus Woesebacteria bacterium]MCB9800989.1 elongation factor 4 [Pseudomonadales bacterium]
MQNKIRNFSIIAHIDHGKTTLTDRFLHITNTVSDTNSAERIMDSNPIEQERGITIKLAPARMEYKGYILNLIDTPGHVDFGYEVSRSLAACEGSLLVVDASQGIQAQTLSNYEQAKALGLTIIPVVNKVDLPSAEVERVMLEIMELCNCDDSDIIQVSAKTGINVEAVLDAVIEKVPAPTGKPQSEPRALLITSHYDVHKGAIGLVRVVDGELSRKKLHFLGSGVSFLPIEVGIFSPEMKPVEMLHAGEVGYIATGLKDIRTLKIGDTVTEHVVREKVSPLPGYKEPTPMVFMELYPTDAAEFTLLQDAMEKLALRDAALTFTGTHSMALGSGLRVGFLGILHAEIVLERMSREFNLEIIATLPSVTYKVETTDGNKKDVQTPGDMPDPAEIRIIQEPIAFAHIYTPRDRMGDILNLVRDRRGEFKKSTNIGQRMLIECEIPLAEIITDFHDVLKSLTSGYASLEYSLREYRTVDAVKVSIMLNHEPVDALSFIAVREKAEYEGRKIVSKLKEILPRQMFELPIQAAIGGKVIARETLKAFRKDVTAKLYGGDVTRRKKLLAKQAKGKKRMKQFGKVEIDQQTFMSILKRS